MRKQTKIIFIFILAGIILFLIYLIKFSSVEENASFDNDVEKDNAEEVIAGNQEFTLFTFVLGDTNEPLDGGVYFDNTFIGNTTNGQIKIPLTQNTSYKELIFRGNYYGGEFELFYAFPTDYKEYLEIPFTASKLDIESAQQFGKEDMFSNTTELHWTHMPLIYNYYNCSQSYIDKITEATEFITNRTESITFRFVKNQLEIPDISFICVDNRKIEYTNRNVINIMAEAAPYIYEELNIYAPSQVFIYSISSCSYGRPTTEIHEILHLLGLQHPKYAYEDDIMNPKHVGCKADITEEELKYLKSIYD